MRSHTDGYAVMIYLFRFALCGARSSDVDLSCDFRPYNVGIDIHLCNKQIQYYKTNDTTQNN